MKQFFFVSVLSLLSFSLFAQTYQGFDYVGRTCEITVYERGSDALKVQLRFTDDLQGELVRELTLYKDLSMEGRYKAEALSEEMSSQDWDASFVIGKNYRYSSYDNMTQEMVSIQCQKLQVIKQ